MAMDTRHAVATIRLHGKLDLTGGQTQAALEQYADPATGFQAGVWTSQPYTATVNYDTPEFCYLLEGEVRLTDAAGRVETYRAGDAFVIPAGFSGTWESVTAVRKFYTVAEPAR